MPKQFIAVLDHEHLENSVFLTAFARSLASLGDRCGIIIHGDSPFTDRLIQTGMMREDARARAIKDLNKRLIGLFADEGIPTIGLHGYQKELIQKNEDTLRLNNKVMQSLPEKPNLLISNLIDDNGESSHLPLPELTRFLYKSMPESEVLLFSKNERDEILIQNEQTTYTWAKLPNDVKENGLPDEFHSYNSPVKLITATGFSSWPKLKSEIFIT